jgi:predicted hydrolase (HD superfamily)
LVKGRLFCQPDKSTEDVRLFGADNIFTLHCLDMDLIMRSFVHIYNFQSEKYLALGALNYLKMNQSKKIDGNMYIKTSGVKKM